MSNFDEEKAKKIFNSYMGLSEEDSNVIVRNPANAEVINALDHNDMWGFEARVFSVCFQRVREKAGPFKIFGSR